MADPLTRAFDLLAKVPTLHERAGAPLGWLARRRLREALELFRARVAETPQDAVACLGLGRALHAAGELDEAVRVLSGGTPLPDAHHELALLAMARGDAVAAETHARAAVEGAPNDVECLIDYALALLLAKQTKRALGVITNACKVAPDNARCQPVLQYVRRVLSGDEPSPDKLAPGD
jgi:Flp pilus assembly protein TadD